MPIVPGGLVNAVLYGAVLALCSVGSLRYHIRALLQGSHQAHDELQDAAQHLTDAEVQRDDTGGLVAPIRLLHERPANTEPLALLKLLLQERSDLQDLLCIRYAALHLWRVTSCLF